MSLAYYHRQSAAKLRRSTALMILSAITTTAHAASVTTQFNLNLRASSAAAADELNTVLGLDVGTGEAIAAQLTYALEDTATPVPPPELPAQEVWDYFTFYQPTTLDFSLTLADGAALSADTTGTSQAAVANDAQAVTIGGMIGMDMWQYAVPLHQGADYTYYAVVSLQDLTSTALATSDFTVPTDLTSWGYTDLFLLKLDSEANVFTGPGDQLAYGELTPVPVPAAGWFLGAGLLGLVGARRAF